MLERTKGKEKCGWDVIFVRKRERKNTKKGKKLMDSLVLE